MLLVQGGSEFSVKQACPRWDQKNIIVLIISIINEVTGSNESTYSVLKHLSDAYYVKRESSLFEDFVFSDVYSLKFICDPRINIHAFTVIRGHVHTQSSGKYDSPYVRIPS